MFMEFCIVFVEFVKLCRARFIIVLNSVVEFCIVVYSLVKVVHSCVELCRVFCKKSVVKCCRVECIVCEVLCKYV